mmetsp:Transcript_115687/g.327131  ORF Transcript_115687/g.327131 Transcript_115687/m.327131 type:complete len:242 (-) Transcript_115687:101-826(-)
MLRHLARIRMGSRGAVQSDRLPPRPPMSSPDDGGAAYLEWVCEMLLASHLRDVVAGPSEATICGDDSVFSWRMRRICAAHGLGPLWDEVARRLDCGGLLFLTARPAPLLDEELGQIKRLVDQCSVASIATERNDLGRAAFGCDVLYVAGVQDRALLCLHSLRTLRASLAILNVCRSERLAKHFVAQGVSHVSYWPASVHDAEATDVVETAADVAFCAETAMDPDSDDEDWLRELCWGQGRD